MQNCEPGFIINHSTIAVDFWPYIDLNQITHFFLTHAHSDHTKNLTASWKGPPLYCSTVFYTSSSLNFVYICMNTF